LTLDMSRMRDVTVDPDARLARVGPGCRLSEVDRATQGHGLATVLGFVSEVGVAGLTLGGGFGYLTRRFGWAVDNLEDVEIVTADGRIRIANRAENADLFWALRGGGGNFGVVTRFTFRLHPLDAVTGGMLVLPATAETIAGFVAAAEAAPEELSGIANVMTAPPMPFIPEEHHGEIVILAMLVHAGPVEEGEQAVAPFRALAPPLADLVRPMPYREIYPPDEPEYRPLAAARTLFVDTIGPAEAELALERLRASTAQMAAVQLRALGGALARVPAEATAFAHRRSRIMVNVAAIYGSPDEAPEHEEWVAGLADALRQGDGGMYVNFVGDEGEAAVRASYPGETWDRLAAIKRRYDPGNLFRLNQNIPPAPES
jgi:FAD/FMN-containing dehydrogenase